MSYIKLAVVGSRSYNDWHDFVDTLEDLLDKHSVKPWVIISGGAEGVDKMAKRYALDFEVPYCEVPAAWEQNGKAAGMIRNRTIVELADYVIAFWDEKSRGTHHTINEAKRHGKLLDVVYTERVT